MSEPVYRVIELVGTSPKSIEEAVQNALSRAGETLRNLDWFQVVETRGSIDANNKVADYQVVMKVGFTIESASTT